MDLVCRYVKQGRFGKFVTDFLQAEYDRKKEQAEKENEWMLWIAYVQHGDGESFADWKKRILKPAASTKRNRDDELTDEGIKAIIDNLPR